MGKDLNGNELGNGICQRKNGLYYARIRRCGVKDINIYSKNLSELSYKLEEARKNIPHELLSINIPKVLKSNDSQSCLTENGAFVYFITDGEYVKIGVASSVKNRLKTLQTGNAKELKIIHSEYSKNPYDLEKKYHDKYKKYHVRGEWYNISNIVNF